MVAFSTPLALAAIILNAASLAHAIPLSEPNVHLAARRVKTESEFAARWLEEDPYPGGHNTFNNLGFQGSRVELESNNPQEPQEHGSHTDGDDVALHSHDLNHSQPNYIQDDHPDYHHGGNRHGQGSAHVKPSDNGPVGAVSNSSTTNVGQDNNASDLIGCSDGSHLNVTDQSEAVLARRSLLESRNVSQNDKKKQDKKKKNKKKKKQDGGKKNVVNVAKANNHKKAKPDNSHKKINVAKINIHKKKKDDKHKKGKGDKNKNDKIRVAKVDDKHKKIKDDKHKNKNKNGKDEKNKKNKVQIAPIHKPKPATNKHKKDEKRGAAAPSPVGEMLGSWFGGMG